jgi:transcriptional regulator with XRE-family HTH domain
MMSKHEFIEHLSALKLSYPEVAQFLGVSERTARRWAEGESVPGPVEAALRAWRRLDAQWLPWKPHSVSVFQNDQDELRRIRNHDQVLDTLMREVEARGGPSTYWAVDLAKQRATFGPAEVSFHMLQQGRFLPTTYRRVDRAPTDDDRREIQDACYCIAQAIARSRAANKALIDIAEYTRQHAALFVREGPSSPSADEVTRCVESIKMLADELSGLASSALEGNALYAKFEGVLDALHRLGFFPEQQLVSAVARGMIGPAPRPDVLTGSSS